MKTFLLSLFFVLLLSACGSYEYYTRPSFQIGNTYTATVGSSMLTVENGTSSGLGSSGYMQELSYSGLANNTLLLSYREYQTNNSSAYIKGDYNQHLQYDISQNKIISFRDMQLEILEANSNTITFKVIKWEGDKKYKEWKEEQEKIQQYKKDGKWQ